MKALPRPSLEEESSRNKIVAASTDENFKALGKEERKTLRFHSPKGVLRVKNFDGVKCCIDLLNQSQENTWP
ncbi:hypothetical protein LguiA_005759 [Lonicera macranthoides]